MQHRLKQQESMKESKMVSLKGLDKSSMEWGQGGCAVGKSVVL